MIDLSAKIPEYLKKKLSNFQLINTRGQFFFTCPMPHKWQAKTPSATLITVEGGATKFYCAQCGFKGTIFDVVRVLEPDKKNQTDALITEYLIPMLDMGMYAELDKYREFGWSLLPVAKNSKNPIETGWSNITHCEKTDWIKWLNNGLNIGARTGKVSDITVIDVDNKGELSGEVKAQREELINLLLLSGTLKQVTPSQGTHYVFKYDADIKQGVNLGGMHIDVRNDGGQIVVQPSTRDGKEYKFEAINTVITAIPEAIKAKLIALSPVHDVETFVPQLILPPIRLKNNNLDGCCNDTFVQLGGMLRKELNVNQVRYTLALLNKYLLQDPMESKVIEAMLTSLEGYHKGEDESIEQEIAKYFKEMQNDVTAKDIMDSLGLKRGIVDKYLSKMALANKIIRLGRGRYKYRERIEWSDSFPIMGQAYPHKIPYFDHIAYFEEGDIILLGGRTNVGKTTIAINMLKQMQLQGIKPYYIYNESGSRFVKIMNTLGLKEGDFFFKFHTNPLSIEIEPHAFTIIDWLLIEDKSTTDVVLSHLNQEMQRKEGVLVIFTQLKDDNSWFAPNLIQQFPAFAARYIYLTDDGKEGNWVCDKIKEPKGKYKNYTVNCTYEFDQKILKLKEQI